MSLVTDEGDAAIVRPAIYQFPVLDPDLTVRDGKDIALELATLIEGDETVHDRSTPHDVYFSLQDLVVLTMSQPGDTLTMWVSRGMGDLDDIEVEGLALNPTELRFGTPDFGVGFEGLVHSVKVWTDRAISREEIELERYAGRFTGFPPEPVVCVGDLDGDNDTDVFDFAIFIVGFGGPGGPEDGDLTGDGEVNIFDFAIFAPDFGCEP